MTAITKRRFLALSQCLLGHLGASEALLAGRGQSRIATLPCSLGRREFVACDVLSRLQRVMEDPRFLLGGECVPLRAGDRFRVYATRGPYVCIYPHDTIAPCKWTHEKALSR